MPPYHHSPKHSTPNQTVGFLQLSFPHVEPLQKCHPFCAATQSVSADRQCGDYRMLAPNPSPRRHHQHYTALPQLIYHIRGGGWRVGAEATGQILREATRSLWRDMRSLIWYQGRGKKEGPSSNFVRKQFKKDKCLCKHDSLPSNIEIPGTISLFFVWDKWNVIRASEASFSGGGRLDLDVS